MHIDEQGMLDEAEFTASPNFNERPDPANISLLVIHNISLPPDQFGGPHIAELFTNTLDPDQHAFFEEIKHLRVSAHALIRRDGQLQQFVPFNQRAWHAGVSEFCGRQQCNDFSVGIELEGSDHVPFEPAQYQTLIELTRALLARYPAITPLRIAGHSEIAPGRKTDPGPFFDWAYYLHQLRQ